MTAAHSEKNYYLPQPGAWPVITAFGLFTLALGLILTMNGIRGGSWAMLLGAVIIGFTMIRWFRQVIAESESGSGNARVDRSFRWGMAWFIFSEVMCFAAFFGALFYLRHFAVPRLGATELLWPGYEGVWPTAGPRGPVPIVPDNLAAANQFSPMGALGIPAINTLILLFSAVTVTWAHGGLLRDNRAQLITGLFLTVALGITFLALQTYQSIHAYSELGLTLKAGVYGATFFLLTGIHGFHVALGIVMLGVILGRSLVGHFRPDHHFGFEAVAWYWHFVDVVWLFLFIFVYWM